MKLSDVIEEMGLKPGDEILLSESGKRKGSDNSPINVRDIPKEKMSKEVKLIQPNCGGQKNKYRLFRFFVE